MNLRASKESTTWHSWNGAFTGSYHPLSLWYWSWCPLPLWSNGTTWLVLGLRLRRSLVLWPISLRWQRVVVTKATSFRISSFIPGVWLWKCITMCSGHFWHGSWLSGLRRLESTEACSSWHPVGSFSSPSCPCSSAPFWQPISLLSIFPSFTHIFPLLCGIMPSNGDRDCQCQPELYKAGAVLEHEKDLIGLGWKLCLLVCAQSFLAIW